MLGVTEDWLRCALRTLLERMESHAAGQSKTDVVASSKLVHRYELKR